MEENIKVICIMPDQAASIVRASQGIGVTVDQFKLQGNHRYSELSIDPDSVVNLPKPLQEVIEPIVRAFIALEAESLD